MPPAGHAVSSITLAEKRGTRFMPLLLVPETRPSVVQQRGANIAESDGVRSNRHLICQMLTNGLVAQE